MKFLVLNVDFNSASLEPLFKETCPRCCSTGHFLAFSVPHFWFLSYFFFSFLPESGGGWAADPFAPGSSAHDSATVKQTMHWRGLPSYRPLWNASNFITNYGAYFKRSLGLHCVRLNLIAGTDQTVPSCPCAMNQWPLSSSCHIKHYPILIISAVFAVLQFCTEIFWWHFAPCMQ